jgi:hypothetical protein
MQVTKTCSKLKNIFYIKKSADRFLQKYEIQKTHQLIIVIISLFRLHELPTREGKNEVKGIFPGSCHL